MTADLFGHDDPVPPQPRIWSVGDLTRSVRATLEEHVGTVWVEGEISNFRKQPSGHQYFTLKDAHAQLACVWFARPAWRMKQIALSDGMQVQVRGSLTVYEARGQYQLSVQLAQAAGAGLLQAKFEALKRKLDAEGLFDPARKRPLPKFPSSIGLITSASGAALHDVLNVLRRRAPWVQILLLPVRVQGEGAAGEIVRAIGELNDLPRLGLRCVDVILVARGGGSIEDLWPFNEEAVARAIAASSIPVIAAVGHEIDFTIADFVADLRAPTPSAAAELVVPDGAALMQKLERSHAQIRRLLAAHIKLCRERLSTLARNALLREPERHLGPAAQRLDLAKEALERVLQERLHRGSQRLSQLAALQRQFRPERWLMLRRLEFETLRRRSIEAFERCIKEHRAHVRRLHQAVQHLSPESLLKRGFSMTTLADGKVVSSVADVTTGTLIFTRLRDGSLQSEVQ